MQNIRDNICSVFILGLISASFGAMPFDSNKIDLNQSTCADPVQSERVDLPQAEVGILNQVFAQIQEELRDLRGQVEVQQQMIQQLKLQVTAQDKPMESAPVKRSTFSFLGSRKSEATERDPDYEKKLFQQAYRLVMDQGDLEAVSSLKKYLTEYPNGEYALDSYYWLGEVCFNLWQQDRAQTEYLNRSIDAFSMLKNNPENPKTSQALLKLGLIESEQGHINAAKQYFESVRESYPHSVSAKVAHARLLKLSQLSDDNN